MSVPDLSMFVPDSLSEKVVLNYRYFVNTSRIFRACTSSFP